MSSEVMSIKNNKNADHYNRLELLALIIIAVIIIVGIIFEIMVHSGCVKWVITDLRSFTMTVLQIQAGVSTLAVALLALISGMTTEEAYGISATHYYMTIRPHFFKQHRVIIACITLLFVGVILEALEYYNLVFSMFFCEWVLISISIITIMPAFKGKRTCEKAIHVYLLDSFKNASFDRQHELIKSLLDSSKPYHTNYNWDDMEVLLNAALDRLIQENTNESVSLLNNEWCQMISAHLRHNDSWVVKRGVVILQDTYSRIWSHILNHKDESFNTETPELFQNLYEELTSALNHISMADIEECFRLDRFLEYIIRVASYYSQDDQRGFTYACKQTEWFAQYFGHLLKTKMNTSMIASKQYNSSYWGRMLKRQHINSLNIPDEISESFLLNRCKVYLGYTISLIKDGHTDLFDEYYLESSEIYISDYRYVILYRIATACFLYYTARVERYDLVPKVARECSDHILSSDKFKTHFTSILKDLNYRKILFDQNELSSLLLEFLRLFEFFKDGQAKTVVMDSTTEIFSIFIQTYVANNRHWQPDFIDDVKLDQLEGWILNYLEGPKRELTKKRFLELFQTLIYTHTDSNWEKNAEALFYQWERSTLEHCKKEKIAKALINSSFIHENDNKEAFQNEASVNLLEHFKERFKLIIDQNISGPLEQEYTLMRLTCDSDYILTEQSLSDMYCYLDGLLIDRISTFLYQENAVTLYDRLGKNDCSFIEDLRRNSINLLIGDEYELDYVDFRNWKIYRDFWEECNCEFISNANTSLAIRKGSLLMAIRDIIVSIKDSSLDTDTVAEYIEETDSYRINLVNNVAALFSKEEAESYIKNQRKIVIVRVKVAIHTQDDPIGFLVEGKRYE